MNEAVIPESQPSIMVIDADVLVRHVLAEYLRTCGYRVIEAASTDEAAAFMYEAGLTLEAVITDAQARVPSAGSPLRAGCARPIRRWT